MVIAQAVGNPVAVAPLAFASHLVLDAFPHFGFKGASFTDKRWLALATVDCLVGSAVTLAVVWQRPEQAAALLTGVFFAVLPDLLFLSAIFLKRPINNAFTLFHTRIQWGESPPGGLVELAWAAAMAWLLLK